MAGGFRVHVIGALVQPCAFLSPVASPRKLIDLSSRISLQTPSSSFIIDAAFIEDALCLLFS
jgi:hypothetical protein